MTMYFNMSIKYLNVNQRFKILWLKLYGNYHL